MELLNDGRIVAFGGHSTADAEKDTPAVYNGDICVLDVQTMVWTRPRALGDDFPSGRTGHSLCRVGDTVVVVGGWAGVRRSMVFEYLPVPDNFAERDISLLKGYMFMLDGTKMEWEAPPVANTDNPHRYGHSTTVVGDYLFLWGGWDGNRPLNDLQVLDLSPLALSG